VSVPFHQIRAEYSDTTVTVYQAYSPEIARAAVAAGRFVEPFRRGRMTWIKPSFLWMMYRCGWAEKPGQERVLRIEITRAGFAWALAHSCHSHFVAGRYTDHADWSRRLAESPVRIQWDPERDPALAPLPYRSLQVGLAGAAVDRYVDEWIVSINDITPAVRAIRSRQPGARVPIERPYPLSPELADAIGADAY
jgi:hypothetical protein